MATLSGMIASGVTLVLLENGRLDPILRPIPRIETFEAKVLAVTADRDGIGIEREDGSQEGFALLGRTSGESLLDRGESVLLDVAYLEDGTFVVRARPPS